jgi:hypothetical protein
MRRRPTNQNNGGGYNNQHRRPRFQQGGGEHRPPSGGHRGPRRNYPQAREKYLQQARDALASGDRVLAENYFQHADHCYRMMVEEGYFTRHQTPAQPTGDTQVTVAPSEEFIQENTNQLPSFLTAQPEHQGQPPAEPPVQNWEERDA